jgi:zinc protease
MEIAIGLEDVGASLDINSGVDNVTIDAGCLSKDFNTVISTLADEVRRPDFPADQLERLRSQILSGLESDKQDSGGTGGPGALATIALAQALYPAHHPYWSPSIDDQTAAVKSITQDDISGFYHKYYRPDTLTIVVVGDISVRDAIKVVSADFGDWAKPAAPKPVVNIPVVALPAKSPKPQIIAIPGAMQSSILVGHVGVIKRSDPDFYPAAVMNYILGGSTFGSRLGDEIRDRRGLAYSVESDFDAGYGAGPVTVFFGANPGNVNVALATMRQVEDKFIKDGVTAREVKEAVDYLNGAYPLRLETNAGLARVILAEENYGLGLDYVNKRAQLYKNVTVAQVNALARRTLHPDKAALVISGAAPK